MRAIFYALFVFTVLSISPAKAQELQRMQGGHCFTLDVPNYMVRTYELNDVASLQYLNKQKETYTMVIVDTKDELEAAEIKYLNAKEFLDQFLSIYNLEAKQRKQGKIIEFDANNNGHAQVEMSWKTEDEFDIYMLITIVETGKAFYKVLSWTLLESKESYKPDFLAMSKSLKD